MALLVYLSRDYVDAKINLFSNDVRVLTTCRNKRQFSDMDESAALSAAMEDVLVVNGLEYKMSCSSSKVLDIFCVTTVFEIA